MAHSTVKKLFSLLGNSGKPDSAPRHCGQTRSQPRFIAFDASKICIFDAILAAKQAARKKFSPGAKIALSHRPPAARWQNRISPQTGRTQSFRVRCSCRTGRGQPVLHEGKDGSTVGMLATATPEKSGSAPVWPGTDHDRRAAKDPAPTEQGPDKPDNKGSRPEKALTQRRDRW